MKKLAALTIMAFISVSVFAQNTLPNSKDIRLDNQEIRLAKADVKLHKKDVKNDKRRIRDYERSLKRNEKYGNTAAVEKDKSNIYIGEEQLSEDRKKVNQAREFVNDKKRNKNEDKKKRK